jgi:hypothetical protein
MYTFRTLSLDPAAQARTVAMAGVVYGLVFVAGFAAAFWGLDAAQLAQASAYQPWAKLLLGLALCLPVGALAGWLAARVRWSGVSILIWIGVAPLIAWLGGHIPYEGLSWLARLSDPYPSARAMYAFTPAAAAFTTLSMVIGAGIGLITGPLQLLAVDRAWNYTTAAHRLSLRSLLVLCICLPGAIGFGLLADFQINSPTRDPLVQVGQAVEAALDPARDLRAARVPFLEDVRSQLTPDYTLYLVRMSPDLETATVDARFDTGLILRCQHGYGQIFTCSTLDEDLRAWQQQLATRGRFTCVGCPVLAERAVRVWLAAALPHMGALREVTFLQHLGGWLYQRATFESGHAIDCRFRGHRPVLVDLCVEAQPPD